MSETIFDLMPLENWRAIWKMARAASARHLVHIYVRYFGITAISKKQAERIAQLEFENRFLRSWLCDDYGETNSTIDEYLKGYKDYTEGQVMSELQANRQPVSDEDIDVLLADLDDYAVRVDYNLPGLPILFDEIDNLRAIVRKWLPVQAPMCPKRVRSNITSTPNWVDAGDILDVVCIKIFPHAPAMVYVDHPKENNAVYPIRYEDCEPVAEEA